MSELRKNILGEAKRIVIKIGSRILVDSERGGVRTKFIQRLAHSVSKLLEDGKEVIIVTSGAVGTGMAILGYDEKPKADEGAWNAFNYMDEEKNGDENENNGQ